ncbi:MAG: DUF2971 domain-containing protein [Flavipsychrobacter sp.]|nr:DUF2971 domain-containing protein [Flavipsychrobacter sp.]
MDLNTIEQSLIATLKSLGIERHNEGDALYKYTTIEAAKAILGNCSIRYSSPINFNDPFEFNRKCIDIGCTQEEMEFRLRAVLQHNPPPQGIDEYLKNISIQHFQKTYFDTLEEERTHSLIQCYSEIRDEILMWSHYAKSHSGVCIGIRVPTFGINEQSLTMRVNYTHKITPIRMFSTNQMVGGLALVYWVYTKSERWGYEKEVRTHLSNADGLFEVDGDLYSIQPLDKTQICSLTFGINTPQKDVDDILSIAKSAGYNLKFVSRMELGEPAFDLVEKFI